MVDNLADLLPPIIKRDWLRTHRTLPSEEQIHPFPEFMKFLEEERKTAYRESGSKSLKSGCETNKPGRDNKKVSKTFHGEAVDNDEAENVKKATSVTTNHCAVHEGADHKTSDCSDFVNMKKVDRMAVLREKKLCFRCFGNHSRMTCKAKDKWSVCGLNNHHVLMCRDLDSKPTESHHTLSVQSNISYSKPSSLFAIHDVPRHNPKELATVFYDGGSNTSYVLNRSLKRLKAVKLKEATLKVTTLGGDVE